jgi:hypothetical protein
MFLHRVHALEQLPQNLKIGAAAPKWLECKALLGRVTR